MEQRAPSRAKATNILRPASRAQGGGGGGPSTSQAPTPLQLQSGGVPGGYQQQQQQQQHPMPQLPRTPGGGASGTPRMMSPFGGMQMGLPAGQQHPYHSNAPGAMRRPPSSSQIHGQYGDPSFQPPLPGSGGNGHANARQRVNSYYEGMPKADFAQGPPRSGSRSGSRADMASPAPGGPHQLPPRSSSRAGVGAGGIGSMGQTMIGMGNFFGGGFGSVSGGMGGMMPPMAPQHNRQQSGYMAPSTGAEGGRPGSSMQVTHPSRPATSTGFRTTNAAGSDADGPKMVNVARGGARVIGPIRAKVGSPENPASALNPIPQSPSSVLGEHIPNALAKNAQEAGRSRSNSAVVPTDETIEAAEARVSRKIQDLEISNKSLLSVNTQLESRVKEQRKQINELKKQLQSNMPYNMPGDENEDNDEISDEALRLAIKEDKVFERLISNLEHLIQDAKEALEYRSTTAAGKVISALELAEEDSQLTVGKSSSSRKNDEAEATENNENEGEGEGEGEDKKDESSAGSDVEAEKENTTETTTESAKLQEARELVARLMVLALSAPDPQEPNDVETITTKPGMSRIPKRMGGSTATPGNSSGHPARPASALRGGSGLRSPVKSKTGGARISSFRVASENTPVRSVSAASKGKDTASIGESAVSVPDDKEQILDICRKLQQIL